MDLVRTLVYSCQPSWYGRLHDRPLEKVSTYLLFMLLTTAIIRTAIFYGWNQHVIERNTADSCFAQIGSMFPKNTEMGTYTHSKTVFFRTIPDIDGRPQEQTIHRRLPNCFIDTAGLVVSYLSKNALGPEDVWGSIAPIVLYSNEDDRAVRKHLRRRWKNDEIPFLSFRSEADAVEQRGTDEVKLLDYFDVKRIAIRYMNLACPEEQVGVIVCTKLDVTRKLLKLKTSITKTYRHVVKAMGVVFMLWLMAVVFILDFLDLWVAAGLVKYLLSWPTVRSLLRIHGEQEAALSELNLRFFFALVVHTATPVLLYHALMPIPIFDFPATGAIVHLGFTFYVLRKRILPALVPPVADDVAPPTDASVARNTVVDDSWEKYFAYQAGLKEFANGGDSLRTVLSNIHDQVAQFSTECTTTVVHVWSCLNNYEDTAKEPVGGPGFCYGMSMQTGVYVLLGWYHLPTSETGLEFLARFPGRIIISKDDPCPTSLYQPTRDELEQMNIQLGTLRQQLQSLTG